MIPIYFIKGSFSLRFLKLLRKSKNDLYKVTTRANFLSKTSRKLLLYTFCLKKCIYTYNNKKILYLCKTNKYTSLCLESKIHYII